MEVNYGSVGFEPYGLTDMSIGNQNGKNKQWYEHGICTRVKYNVHVLTSFD